MSIYTFIVMYNAHRNFATKDVTNMGVVIIVVRMLSNVSIFCFKI